MSGDIEIAATKLAEQKSKEIEKIKSIRELSVYQYSNSNDGRSNLWRYFNDLIYYDPDDQTGLGPQTVARINHIATDIKEYIDSLSTYSLTTHAFKQKSGYIIPEKPKSAEIRLDGQLYCAKKDNDKWTVTETKTNRSSNIYFNTAYEYFENHPNKKKILSNKKIDKILSDTKCDSILTMDIHTAWILTCLPILLEDRLNKLIDTIDPDIINLEVHQAQKDLKKLKTCSSQKYIENKAHLFELSVTTEHSIKECQEVLKGVDRNSRDYKVMENILVGEPEKHKLLLRSNYEEVSNNNLYLSLKETKKKQSLLYSTKLSDETIVRDIEITAKNIDADAFKRITTAIKKNDLLSISENDKNEILKFTSAQGHTENHIEPDSSKKVANRKYKDKKDRNLMNFVTDINDKILRSNNGEIVDTRFLDSGRKAFKQDIFQQMPPLGFGEKIKRAINNILYFFQLTEFKQIQSTDDFLPVELIEKQDEVLSNIDDSDEENIDQSGEEIPIIDRNQGKNRSTFANDDISQNPFNSNKNLNENSPRYEKPKSIFSLSSSFFNSQKNSIVEVKPFVPKNHEPQRTTKINKSSQNSNIFPTNSILNSIHDVSQFVFGKDSLAVQLLKWLPVLLWRKKIEFRLIPIKAKSKRLQYVPIPSKIETQVYTKQPLNFISYSLKQPLVLLN